MIARLLPALLLFTTVARADDWRPLFTGEDLHGWVQLAGDEDRRGTFHVEDGVIVGTFVDGTRNTFLATEETFDDFILEFEFFVPDGVNSGVQFRSIAAGIVGRVTGLQYEIDPSPRAWTAGLYHEAGRGWLYPLELNPDAKNRLKINDWNTAKIECIGQSVRTWLNGAPATHLIDTSNEGGFIALQVHGMPKGDANAGKQMKWRNIRIRDVTEEAIAPLHRDLFIRNLNPNDLHPAEQAQGWRRLFNGRDTDYWRGVHNRTFPPRGWRVADGELIVEGHGANIAQRGGDIITRERFVAFEFQTDFLVGAKGNSGIKYNVNDALGLEYQVLDDDGHPDGALGEDRNRTMASLYDLIPSARKVNGRSVPRRVGDWNHARIVFRPDGVVQHWLNDFKVVEYVRGSDDFLARIARSKYRDIPNFGRHEDGHILLQDHGDEVRYRSIKVRVLR